MVNVWIMGVLFLSASFLILVFMIFCSGFLIKYISKKNEKMLAQEEKFFDSIDFDSKSNDTQTNKVNLTNLLLISENELEKGKTLGQGAFGTVFEGYYKPNGDSKKRIKVAIKELNSFPSNSHEKIKELENEIVNVSKIF